MLYLRQATSATVIIGPYTGSDGVALTGLTLAQGTFQLSKNGDAFASKNNTTNGSHRILGYYSAMFDSTDTGSLGRLLVVSSAAAALPVWHEFTVLPSSVFDALIQGTDLLMTDVRQINGSDTNANSAILSLRQLSVVNAGGSAIVGQSTGNNGHGFEGQGNGVGQGMRLTGGAAGPGMNIEGTTGMAISATLDGGHGIAATGQGSNGYGLALTGGSSGYPVNSATMIAFADHALARDMSAIGNVAARSPLNALRVLRNRLTTSGGFLTIYAEDDTTAVWTSALTTNGSAAPVVESDPA